MSSENLKRRKRERIRELFSRRGPELRAEEEPGLHSIGESSAHTPAATSSLNSVPSAVAQDGLSRMTMPSAAMPAPSTQNLTSQPVLTSATVVATDTAHTPVPVQNDGEQPISTAAGSSTAAAAQSLWSGAISSDELSPQERRTLAGIGFGVDSQTMASAVRSMTDGILSEKEGELWKVKFRKEEIVLRDVGMKVLRWVDKFKQIGDIIVQYDPVHAALPWAGFRFLLQVDLIR